MRGCSAGWVAASFGLLIASARAQHVNDVEALAISFDENALTPWSQEYTCSPYSWDDYSVIIDAAHTDENLMFEVEDLNPDIEGYSLDKLSLHLFPQSIPSDRVARQVATQAIDLVYSITIDSHHLHAYTYYASVKCGPIPTTYRVRALAIHAEVMDGAHVAGMVCPGAWTYHYFHADSSSAHSDLQFRLRLSTGDVSYMTAHLHPPLKLRPPYRSVDYSAHSDAGVYTEASLCSVEEGKQFFALRGQGHCAEYELHLDVMSHESSCVEMVHDCEGDGCDVQCDEIALDQFVYAQCAPDSWYDFKLEVTPDNADSNMAITVEDMSKFRTPEAISLHMYTEGEIPIDRHTEHRTTVAPDGVWGLGLSSYDLKPGIYFFGVHCGGEPARFRILSELIQATVHDGDLIAGEICPGQWMYHHYQAEGDQLMGGEHLHIDFEVKLYTGDLEYMTRHENPPVKLIPPYAETSASDQMLDGSEHVSICNVEHGTSYLGLHGGQHCAMYEVAVHLYTDSESVCTEQTHQGSTEAHAALEELQFEHNVVRSCSAGGYVDFYVNVANQAGRSKPGINLAVETQDLGQYLDPEALSLYLYDGNIPSHRETELRQESSGDGVYSVTVNSNEVHAGRYFISVRCGHNSARFRVLPRAIQAEMYPGDSVPGAVCPGSTILHSFDATHFLGLVVIESDTLGQLSSVSISPLSGLNALDLVGSGTAITGHNEALPSASPATSGSYSGESFTAFDFSAHNEYLVVAVDGHDQMVALTENIVQAGDAVAALNARLTGVAVSEAYGNIVITSSSIGAASTVVLNSAHSGTHATGLFGSGTAIAGSDAGAVGCGTTPASGGSYRSKVFHGYNFVGHEEDLIVVVDGMEQTFTLSTNIQTPYDAVAALQSLSGARARVIPAANVEWRFELHSGDAYFMNRHEDPPLLLAPPYRHVYFGDQGDEHGYAEVCNIESIVYLAMIGGEHCAEYDITLTTHDALESCQELEHDTTEGLGQSFITLSPGHTTDGRCVPGEYVDYKLVVSAQEVDSNMVVVVQDKTGKVVTDALSAYLYRDTIPDDRHTEFKQEFSSTGSWAVQVSEHDLYAGDYFISVRCGSMPVSFKVVPFLVKSKIEDHEHIHAEVCPGGWAYHHINAQETKAALQSTHDWTPGHPLNLILKLQLFTGDVKYTRRWEEEPIKLTPPYSEATAAEQLRSHQYATMQLCNVEVHEEIYIGLLGGHECSEYVISAVAFSDGHIEYGRDAVSAAPATSGSYSGESFTAFDFSSHNEYLVVAVDGHDQMVALTENIVQAGDAVAALNARLTGVAVSEAYGNIVITSSSIGAASTVVLNSAHSGTHATGLFGSGTAIAGTDSSSASDARSGWYKGYHFHAFNFVGHEEDLVLVIDGHDQIIRMSTNIVDAHCALEAIQAVSGADVSIADGQLKVTSQSVGAHSSVFVSDKSGKHAQALFFDVCEEFQGTHSDVSLSEAVIPLVDGHFAYGSCSPGGLHSFAFPVSADLADSGLQITVEDTTGDRDPNALGLYVYAGDITQDLSTNLKTEFSREGVHSIVISAHDLKVCVYHAVIRCISSSSSSFRVVAKLTPAYVGHLGVQGHLCGGGWAYHYAIMDQAVVFSDEHEGGHGRRRQLVASSGKHARFTLLMHTGDVFYITKHGYAPLKLIPPYGHVDPSAQHGVHADICDVTEGEKVYLGLKSTGECADYELIVDWFEGDCAEMEFTDATLEAIGSTAANVRDLEPNHFELGSCEPNSYEDYRLWISEEDSHHLNLEITLEDLSKTLDTAGLGMYLYHGAIPRNRATQHFADFTHDGTYSLAISVNDLQSGAYFIAVLCGVKRTTFRVMAHKVEAVLLPDVHIEGFVCPGDWIYHKYEHVANAHQDATFHLELHTGDLYYTLRPERPAITLTPPFHHTSAVEMARTQQTSTGTACDIHNGTMQYLGLRGGDACSDYYVWVSLSPHSSTCRRFSQQDGLEVRRPMAEVGRTSWTYSSCEADSFQHFFTDLSAYDQANNLAVVVEDLETNTDPESLTVMMFQSDVGAGPPVDPHTDEADASTTRALGKNYALTLNYLQLQEGRVIVTVQCGASPVRFRVVASLVHAKLVEGEHQIGMVFPDKWVYHYFDVTEQMIDSHLNLRFEVLRYTGEVYMAFAREKLPPGFASPNEFQLAVEQETNWTTVICQPHEPERVYYGLYGGEVQAEYDIMVDLFTNEHCDTDGQPGYNLASADGSDEHRRMQQESDWWRS